MRLRGNLFPRPRAAASAPLSFAQERLWFIDQLQPGSTVYNLPGALRIAGALEMSALELAINEIIRRHEALRTTFQMMGEGPIQLIVEYEWQVLPMVDLMGLPERERDLTARKLIGEEHKRAFDLREGPMVRVGLLRMGLQDHVAVIHDASHCVGWVV